MTASTNSTTPPPYKNDVAVTQHKEYYFEEGNLVIKVDNTLFRVWDGPLRRHSKFFASQKPSLDGPNFGESDEHPLVLEDVSADDFEKLLWILYPPVIGQYKATTSGDWIAILSLACRWDFNDIRDLAIKELGAVDLDPLTKIELQQKHKIDAQWAFSSYTTLCSRNDPLTLAEAEKLGFEVTVKIASIREKLERWGRKKVEDVQKQVCEVFAIDPPPAKK